jgi:hypothetical protein
MIANMGICPFTTSSDEAGLPLGKVHYPVSRAVAAEQLYAAYWHEVALLESAPPRALSTTLLITPHFGLSNSEAFMALSDTLTAPLESLGLESSIQLVFFHPQWVFRDGRERIGGDAAGNFARRSPFPMINILRTPQVCPYRAARQTPRNAPIVVPDPPPPPPPQVRIAQRAIPTGLVYRQNEGSLSAVGSAALQRMLVAREWEPLGAFTVNRKSNELYDTAQRLVEQYAGSHASGEGREGKSKGKRLAANPASSAPAVLAPSEMRPEDMDISALLLAMEGLESERTGP